MCLNIVLALLAVALIFGLVEADDCITPNNETAKCISLFDCPILLKAGSDTTTREFIDKSKCESGLMVCCGTKSNFTTDNHAKHDCITPNNERAKCISLLDCPVLLKASSDVTAREFIDKSTCETGLMVCCGTKPNFSTDNHAKQNATNAPGLEHVNQTKCNKNTKAGNNSRSNLTKEEKIKLLPKHCGYQHSDDYFHKVNYTVFTEFPWLAVIETEVPPNDDLKIPAGNAWSQTGSLISVKYVLTVQRSALLNGARIPIKMTGVWLGGYHPLNETQCLEDLHGIECNDPPQHFQIEKVIQKSDTGLATGARIIALLRLSGEVTYSDYIRPICLPLPGTRRPEIGDTVVESSSETWKAGNSPSFGDGTKTRFHLKFQVEDRYSDSNFCAKYIDLICLPYSETNLTTEPVGGPLMFSYRARWYQQGIAVVRFSKDPIGGLYIDVPYHLDWILDSLEP